MSKNYIPNIKFLKAKIEKRRRNKASKDKWLSTYAFKNKTEFDARKDKSINGWSLDFCKLMQLEYNGILPRKVGDRCCGTGNNSEGCWNCLNCDYCTNCTDCTDCKGCKNCNNCNTCSNDKYCSDCFCCGFCEFSFNLGHCYNCVKCSFSEECTKCLKCRECRFCSNCDSCENKDSLTRKVFKG